jgi:hypothetical protein
MVASAGNDGEIVDHYLRATPRSSVLGQLIRKGRLEEVAIMGNG